MLDQYKRNSAITGCQIRLQDREIWMSFDQTVGNFQTIFDGFLRLGEFVLRHQRFGDLVVRAGGIAFL